MIDLRPQPVLTLPLHSHLGVPVNLIIPIGECREFIFLLSKRYRRHSPAPPPEGVSFLKERKREVPHVQDSQAHS